MSRASVDRRFVVLATLVLTCLVTLSSLGQRQSPGFAALHHQQTMTWLIWLLLAPAILAAIRRFPFGDGSPARWVVRHLVFGGSFALVSVILFAAGSRIMRDPGLPPDGLGGGALVARAAKALLLYILIAASYQAVTYQRAVRTRETLAARLRADLAEARLANLEGKFHPHFLFNALNSIAALMREDPRQAEVMLEQLSELLHTALRATPAQEVAFSEALRFAEQYLAIEKTRFETRLRATIHVSEQARLARVPSLILQPLIENAIRHGIAPLESGGLVTVTATVDEATLVIRVEDDGVGLGNAPQNQRANGLGLHSVRSILSHLYGTDQRFDISARMPAGTAVTICLPYRTA